MADQVTVNMFAVGPEDMTSVHNTVSMLNLQTRLIQQGTVRLNFGVARTVNEAIGRFAADPASNVLVCVDKACSFPPDFLVENATTPADQCVVAVCPLPEYDWDRMLAKNVSATGEPDNEQPLVYNVDLAGIALGHKARRVQVEASRIRAVSGMVLHRSALDAVLRRFPERQAEDGQNVALYVEEVRGKRFFPPHSNLLDLLEQCGVAVTVDMANGLGLMATTPFAGACGERAILR